MPRTQPTARQQRDLDREATLRRCWKTLIGTGLPTWATRAQVEKIRRGLAQNPGGSWWVVCGAGCGVVTDGIGAQERAAAEARRVARATKGAAPYTAWME